jgi:non-ribosomal peptide synthetase-like protein
VKQLLIPALELLVMPLIFLVKGLLLGAALLPAALLVRWAWEYGWWAGVLSVGPAYFVFGVALMILVVVVKWAFLYTAEEGAFPFVSWRAARWAFTAQLYDMARFFFVQQVRGTLLIKLYLRLLGARIGRNVILNSAAVGDWDLVSIGDDTMVGDDAVIIGHVGEKGMLRMGKVTIGSRCTIGRDTVLMPGTTIEDGAVVAAMSVVTKGRTIPANTVWAGTALHLLRSKGGTEMPEDHAAD